MIDARQPARAQQAWRHFLETPLDKLLEPGETADAAQRALELFREVAADVPAYGAFLAESGIDPRRIATPAALISINRRTRQPGSRPMNSATAAPISCGESS